MGRLIYGAITSLDGYVADATGSFDWSAPDEEVHAAVNDVLRPAGTHLYGRKMYDVLVAWETMDTGPDEPDVIRDFAAIWRAADKIVYSATLTEPRSERTRIEPGFDPEAVRRMKAEGDLSIGGPTLAAAAFRAGLVDEVHLFVNPVSVGGGLAALPLRARLDVDLVTERRFAGGIVHLHYRFR
jgi:dihydrofolate reductase